MSPRVTRRPALAIRRYRRLFCAGAERDGTRARGGVLVEAQFEPAELQISHERRRDAKAAQDLCGPDRELVRSEGHAHDLIRTEPERHQAGGPAIQVDERDRRAVSFPSETEQARDHRAAAGVDDEQVGWSLGNELLGPIGGGGDLRLDAAVAQDERDKDGETAPSEDDRVW
jgi:hypothetical protein